MKIKKLIIFLILIFLIGLIFFICSFYTKRPNIIKTYGNIEIREVDLSFQVSGVIKDVFVEEGDYVKEGDLLAIIDDRDYIANYKKALYQKDTSYAQLKDDLSRYEKNYFLCKEGIVSKLECDSLINKKDLSSAQFKQNEANLEFQKNQLDYTKLYAPQEGIITTRAQEKGARVNANQIVYVMSLNKPVWIRTYIKENNLGNIKYGQKARVITDTIDVQTNKKKEYKGKIGYISPVAEFSPKTVQTEDLRSDLVYRIRVYVDDVDEYLRQGMPVSVLFDIEGE